MEEIIINGERYVKAGSQARGNRAVYIIDRGWIYAGDAVSIDEETKEPDPNGTYWRLDNAVWVFRWEEVGFNGVIDDPKSSKVDIRRMSNPVEVPKGSVIFRVPVSQDWGL